MGLLGKLFRSAAPAAPLSDWERIDAFWTWWSGVAADVATSLKDDAKRAHYTNLLSAQIAAIDASLNWELGPGKKSQHNLTMSAEGNSALRVLAEKWLSRAPAPSAQWEYYSARQADPRLTVGIAFDELKLEYDAFVIVPKRDDTRRLLHITVYHPAFAGMPEGLPARATFVFLDHMLGEDDVERWLGTIDTTTEAPQSGMNGIELGNSLDEWRGTRDDRFAVLKGKDNEGRPMFASVNMTLKRVDHLLMENHCQVRIALEDPTPDGLTTSAEADVLNALEDELLDRLGPDAVYIGRETGRGERLIHLHIAALGPAQARIDEWIAEKGKSRMSTETRPDPTWDILRRW